MKQVDVQKLAAGSRFNRFHGGILFWCMLALVLDGYDLAIVGAALPSIMADLKVSATEAGFMASSALFGMMFGAIFLGTYADKYGRPVMIAICVALFSVFTAAAGFTSDPISFSITRFIAGLGIGGVMPIASAHMAEFSPAAIRARLVTLVFAGYSIGGILVALTSKSLIEDWGWRSVFFTAAIPVLLVPFIVKALPHSMSFLARGNRQEELRALARRLSPGDDFQPGVEFVLPADQKLPTAPVRALFEYGRGFSTLMVWVAFFTGLFMVYSLSSWLTKLMAMAGYSLGSALNFVLVFNIGAMVGGVVGGMLGDRFNIKYVLMTFYLMGAASLIAMGYTTSTTALFVVVFIVGASTLGTQLLAYAYAGGFYPTGIRSTGVGFASGVGRLGAITAPILIGGLVALELPLTQNFMAIAVAGLVGAASVFLIDHRRYASLVYVDALRKA